MLTVKEAQARVTKGAAVLDAQMPGWAKRINPFTLELSSGCHCVLGQLGAWYALGFSGFVGAGPKAEAHGFFLMKDNQYELLQDAWISAIADRVVSCVPETSVERAESCVAVARTQNSL